MATGTAMATIKMMAEGFPLHRVIKCNRNTKHLMIGDVIGDIQPYRVVHKTNRTIVMKRIDTL